MFPIILAIVPAFAHTKTRMLINIFIGFVEGIIAFAFLSVHTWPRFSSMFVIKRGYVWPDRYGCVWCTYIYGIVSGYIVQDADAICTRDGFNKPGVKNTIGQLTRTCSLPVPPILPLRSIGFSRRRLRRSAVQLSGIITRSDAISWDLGIFELTLELFALGASTRCQSGGVNPDVVST